MRNNRLRSIRERTFRNLRGNIAIIDMDGKLEEMGKIKISNRYSNSEQPSEKLGL